MPKLKVNETILGDVESIAKGAFSPLERFLCKDEFESVLYQKRLSNGIPWTIAVVLGIEVEMMNDFKEGESIALNDTTS